MYQVFNMGHRFEIYTGLELAERMIPLSEEFGVEARIVGRVEAASRRELVIESPCGRYTY
jgi:phosphoribosylformylglycinamidine cyclo-ligase